MKKIFFFLILFLSFPSYGIASSIKELKILNGTLSRVFEPSNNIYSVILNDGEEVMKIEYELEDEGDSVELIQSPYQIGQENKAILKVSKKDNTIEEYVFYLEKEHVNSVFKNYDIKKEETIKEIPNLKYYVGGAVLIIIIILFKLLIL